MQRREFLKILASIPAASLLSKAQWLSDWIPGTKEEDVLGRYSYRGCEFQIDIRHDKCGCYQIYLCRNTEKGVYHTALLCEEEDIKNKSRLKLMMDSMIKRLQAFKAGRSRNLAMTIEPV